MRGEGDVIYRLDRVLHWRSSVFVQKRVLYIELLRTKKLGELISRVSAEFSINQKQIIKVNVQYFHVHLTEIRPMFFQ